MRIITSPTGSYNFTGSTITSSYLPSASFESGSQLTGYLLSGSQVQLNLNLGTRVTLFLSSGSFMSGSIFSGSYVSGSIVSGSTSSSYSSSIPATSFDGTTSASVVIIGYISSSMFSFTGSLYNSSSITGSVNSSGSISGSFYTSSLTSSISASATQVHAKNCPDLLTLDLSNEPGLQTINIISCSRFRYIDLTNNIALTSVTLRKCPLLVTMSFTGCYLTGSVLNSLLIQEYSESFQKTTGSGVIFRLSGRLESDLSSPATYALNQLSSNRNYTVTTQWQYVLDRMAPEELPY